MSIDIVPARPDDLERMHRVDGQVFGIAYSAADIEQNRAILDLDRFRLAVDGGDIVGIAGSFGLELTLPGGRAIPMTAVTWVSVVVTHRRQGLLRRLMDAVHADGVQRGEPLAGLTASEGGIYHRFGYGVATTIPLTTIDRRRTQVRPEYHPAPGSIRILDPTASASTASLGAAPQATSAAAPQAASADATPQPASADATPQAASADATPQAASADVTTRAPSVDATPLAAMAERYDRYRRGQVGEVTRSEAWLARRVQLWGEGAVVALHDDGYAAWSISANWNGGMPAHELTVHDLCAATDEAHAALWATVLSVDLVGPVHAVGLVAPDDPLRHILDDQRALRTTGWNDHVWLRPVDIARCFGERAYRVDDRLILGIDGSAWEVSADGCRRTDAPVDLTLTPPAVGPLLLGGVSASELARGRRLQASSASVLGRADAFFGWDPLPHCRTAF